MQYGISDATHVGLVLPDEQAPGSSPGGVPSLKRGSPRARIHAVPAGPSRKPRDLRRGPHRLNHFAGYKSAVSLWRGAERRGPSAETG
jgi:hypothetical protein